MLASGRLPLGAVGRTEYRALAAGADHFLRLLQAHRPLTRPPHLDVDLSVGEFRVRGRILEFTEAGPLYYRCAKIKAADILRAWVLHLAANCVEAGRKTTMVMEDGTRHYLQPDDPRALLHGLLELWWQGLTAPLKFFPETALAFAMARRKTGRAATDANHDDALHKARSRWEGSEFGRPGECSNPHFALCFRQTDPLDHEFVVLAGRIFEPILAHEVKEEP
jgi:exodeoxyribonuclease V gamma subunit